MQDDLAAQASRRAALTGHEVDRRKAVLARLQDALAAEGFESVLVGRHALTLRSPGGGLAQPSSPRDPELHVAGAGRCHVITTDGRQYRFADSGMHPADDPCGAAGFVLSASAGPDAAVAPGTRAGGSRSWRTRPSARRSRRARAAAASRRRRDLTRHDFTAEPGRGWPGPVRGLAGGRGRSDQAEHRAGL